MGRFVCACVRASDEQNGHTSAQELAVFLRNERSGRHVRERERAGGRVCTRESISKITSLQHAHMCSRMHTQIENDLTLSFAHRGHTLPTRK